MLTLLAIACTQVHGFFSQPNALSAPPASPTTYSVSDSIVAFTPAHTPCSRSLLSHTHSMHTPNLPTSTLLTIICTQVPWFLASLTRPGVSFCVVTTRIRLTLCFTRATQCMRGDPSVLAFGLSSHRHPSICILFRFHFISYNQQKISADCNTSNTFSPFLSRAGISFDGSSLVLTRENDIPPWIVRKWEEMHKCA
jgi:hypothetical protein